MLRLRIARNLPGRRGRDRRPCRRAWPSDKVGPLVTSATFDQGHRIRIEVSSSNFPRFVRNLNTGGNNYDEKEGVIAVNSVHHSATYASRIVLPIVGAD